MYKEINILEDHNKLDANKKSYRERLEAEFNLREGSEVTVNVKVNHGPDERVYTKRRKVIIEKIYPHITQLKIDWRVRCIRNDQMFNVLRGEPIEL